MEEKHQWKVHSFPNVKCREGNKEQSTKQKQYVCVINVLYRIYCT
jgi:hypothetical protein